MDDKEQYRQSLRTLLAEALEGSKAESTIGRDFPFEQDLISAGIDSLDLVEFYLRVEDRFKLKIPQDEYHNLRSIDAIFLFITQEVTGRSA